MSNERYEQHNTTQGTKMTTQEILKQLHSFRTIEGDFLNNGQSIIRGKVKRVELAHNGLRIYLDNGSEPISLNRSVYWRMSAKVANEVTNNFHPVDNFSFFK